MATRNCYGRITHEGWIHNDIRFEGAEARKAFALMFNEYHAKHEHDDGKVPTFENIKKADIRKEDFNIPNLADVTIDGYKAHEIRDYHNREFPDTYTHYHPPTTQNHPIIVVDGDFVNSGQLQRHELSAIFTSMTESDFGKLCNSIEENGFTDPVIRIHEGKILDGWHRYQAAIHLNIVRRLYFKDWNESEEGDPKAFVLARNVHRRHLEPGQRAQIAVKFNDLYGHGGDRSNQTDVQLKTEQELADEMDVSTKTIQRAKQVADIGDAEADAVIAGETTAGQVLRLKEAQSKALTAEEEMWAAFSEHELGKQLTQAQFVEKVCLHHGIWATDGFPEIEDMTDPKVIDTWTERFDLLTNELDASPTPLWIEAEITGEDIIDLHNARVQKNYAVGKLAAEGKMSGEDMDKTIIAPQETPHTRKELKRQHLSAVVNVQSAFFDADLQDHESFQHHPHVETGRKAQEFFRRIVRVKINPTLRLRSNIFSEDYLYLNGRKQLSNRDIEWEIKVLENLRNDIRAFADGDSVDWIEQVLAMEADAHVTEMKMDPPVSLDDQLDAEREAMGKAQRAMWQALNAKQKEVVPENKGVNAQNFITAAINAHRWDVESFPRDEHNTDEPKVWTDRYKLITTEIQKGLHGWFRAFLKSDYSDLGAEKLELSQYEGSNTTPEASFQNKPDHEVEKPKRKDYTGAKRELQRVLDFNGHLNADVVHYNLYEKHFGLGKEQVDSIRDKLLELHARSDEEKLDDLWDEFHERVPKFKKRYAEDGYNEQELIQNATDDDIIAGHRIYRLRPEKTGDPCLEELSDLVECLKSQSYLLARRVRDHVRSQDQTTSILKEEADDAHLDTSVLEPPTSVLEPPTKDVDTETICYITVVYTTDPERKGQPGGQSKLAFFNRTRNEKNDSPESRVLSEIPQELQAELLAIARAGNPSVSEYKEGTETDETN